MIGLEKKSEEQPRSSLPILGNLDCLRTSTRKAPQDCTDTSTIDVDRHYSYTFCPLGHQGPIGMTICCCLILLWLLFRYTRAQGTVGHISERHAWNLIIDASLSSWLQNWLVGSEHNTRSLALSTYSGTSIN